MADWQGKGDRVRAAALVRASYEADLGELRAFLPAKVPVEELPAPFAPYLSACAELPARYPEKGGGVRRWLEREFPTDEATVHAAVEGLTDAERDSAMTLISVLGHTYRWDRVPPAPARFEERRVALPPGITGVWAELARRCGHPRVGTTWSLHLCNWTMTDRSAGAAYRTGELAGDNVRMAHSWLSPPYDTHLDRFSVSFVLMEARGADVLRHLVDTVEAAAGWRVDAAVASLARLYGAITAMTTEFSMSVRKATVDPAIWLELVQPTFPWSAEAQEPGRIEGGPSGIQLGTIQALDAALGVDGCSTLARLSRTGRRYMPRPHRRFLRALDRAAPVVRGFVAQAGCRELTEEYNRCVRALVRFRSTHQARGSRYLRDRPSGDVARTSTGLTIGVDDDPIATFDRTMAERAAETEAAAIAPAGTRPRVDAAVRGP